MFKKKYLFILVLSSFFLGTHLIAKEVKNIFLDDKTVATIPVSPKGTLLSFPIKPNKVILGSSGSFHIEYVENDLAVSPARPGAQSNLFVYLLGRRFIFDLRASGLEGQTLTIIRDKTDAPIPAPKRGKK